jgi:tetratricopeptide (TPR) repeat protein
MRFVAPVLLLLLGTSLHAQPSEEERRFRLAQGYERAGDLASAARIYGDLLNLDPASDAYFDAVQRTYGALGRFADLLPLVETRVARQPGDFVLRVTLADLLFRVGRRDEAMSNWNRAIEIGTFQEFVFAIVASSQVENRAYNAAVQTYRGARLRLGDPTAFGDQIAQLLVITGRYEEATREYVDLLMRDPARLSLTMRGLADATANPIGTAAALRVVEDALRRRPSYQPLLELLAWLHAESGDDDASFDVARRLDEARGGSGSNVFAFADRALRGGRFDAAIEALEHFEARHGDSPLLTSALLLHATALDERAHASGQFDEDALSSIVKRYRDVAHRAPGTPDAAQALLRAATILAEHLDERDAAADLLDELLVESTPRSIAARGRLLHGDLHVASGHLADAEQAYGEVRRTPIGAGEEDVRLASDEAALRIAEIRLFQGRFKEGVDSLTALTRNPSSSVTNDALSLLFLMQENFGSNDSALHALIDASYLARRQLYGDAIERFSDAVRLSRGGSLAEEARYRAALTQRDAGQAQDAVESLLALVAELPEGLLADRALHAAAEILDRDLHDTARALPLYMRVLSEYPTSPKAAVARRRAGELRKAD